MSHQWTLRAVLAEKCGIHSATALKARLEAKAGVQLSLQSLTVLLNTSPNAIRFQTIQAVCTATGLRLSDFCEVLPDPPAAGASPRRLYHTRSADRPPQLEFPSPRALHGKRHWKGYKFK